MAAPSFRARRAGNGAVKKIHMASASGPGPFQQGGHVPFAAGVEVGTHLFLPRRLIEIRREEPTRLVGQHRIDTHGHSARQMVVDDLVGQREKFPGRLRMRGNWFTPEPAGRRGVARLAMAPLPSHRMDILTTPKQAAEQRHLFLRTRLGSHPALRCGNRRARSRNFRDGLPQSVAQSSILFTQPLTLRKRLGQLSSTGV